MEEENGNNEEHNQPQPLATFQSDDLLEKLKLLNYEKQLLREFKMKPISRFYFVKSFNPGEQFFMFTIICWWLCRKLGKEMEKPQESDDPNVVITNIVQILEQIDVPVDFQPNKLIRGAGPICLMVLDCLATQAIKVAKLSCQRLQIAQEEELAAEYNPDNAEIILERLEDEQNGYSDDSELELEELNWISRGRDRMEVLEDPHQMDKLSDQHEWKLECERVLPHLKVFIKSDARDWRSHLSQLETLKSNIHEIAEDTQLQLKKLHSEFTFSLEKIESREKHLNNELQPLIKQFKEISIELSSVQYAQAQVKADMERLQAELGEVIAENDMKKAAMEQRGQSMSDASTVVQIKKAIAKLKDDVAHMNLEVALLVHTIDEDILREAGAGLGREIAISVSSPLKAF